MPASTRSTGVTIAAPDTYRIAAETRDPARPAELHEHAASAPGALRHAIEHGAIEFVDRIDVLQAAAPQAMQTIEVRAVVARHEDVALLIEQDGGYTWSLPVQASSASAATADPGAGRSIHFVVGLRPLAGRPGTTVAVIYVLKFALPVAAARPPASAPSPAPRSIRRGMRSEPPAEAPPAARAPAAPPAMPPPPAPAPPPAASPPAAAPARPPQARAIRRGLGREESTTEPAPASGGAAPEPHAPAARAPAPAPAATRIECHVLAEMDPEVVLGETATVEVSLSRERLTALAGRAAATGGGVQIDAADTLLVQAVPRVNFTLAPGTKDRVEVNPPAADAPVLLYFDVVAQHEGAGEVWIIVRQHQMGVARLVLKPTVVGSPTTGATSRAVAEGSAVAAPPLARPLDQLSIFEQTIGDRVQYLFELEMPSINVFGLHASPPLEVRRDEYVARLYKEIEDRYISIYDRATQSADVAAFTAELQAYGAVLFDRLFPREIQELLWAHRDAIRSVRVVSTEPFIPWEIIHLREPGRAVDTTAPTRFLGEMGLVRWLHNVNGLPPTSLRARPGKARYVIPDYADSRLALPSTVNERLYLEQTFGATAIEAQPNPLRAALSTPGSFDLLHLACHGEAESGAIDKARIVLAGRDEGEIVQTYMNASTVETFAQLRSVDGVQPIVFLNACQAGRAGYQLTGIGGFAQAFLRAGAGAFVGTLWSVADQPAFFFGKAFYEALLRGATVAEAAIAARNAARRDDATWLAYVVYAHPHATLARS